MKQAILPEGLYDATTMGYSHGVLVGDRLEVAGQVSLAEGVEAQAEEAFAAIQSIVEAAGGTMADIVRMTVFTTQADCWQRTEAVRQRYLHAPFPTATMVIVTGLAVPEILLEIEAAAIIGCGA